MMLCIPAKGGHSAKGFPCPHPADPHILPSLSETKTFTVEDAVETIGFGRFHIALFLIMGSTGVSALKRTSAAVILSSLFGAKFLLAPSSGLFVPGNENPEEIMSSAFAMVWLGTMECMCLFWPFKTRLKGLP